jgi:hypothetical protein
MLQQDIPANFASAASVARLSWLRAICALQWKAKTRTNSQHTNATKALRKIDTRVDSETASRQHKAGMGRPGVQIWTAKRAPAIVERIVAEEALRRVRRGEVVGHADQRLAARSAEKSANRARVRADQSLPVRFETPRFDSGRHIQCMVRDQVLTLTR